MVDISIVIVNYNTQEYLGRCVKSIYRSGIDTKDIELIIIDNNSSDSSLQIAQDIIDNEKIKSNIIRNNINVGFSKAINMGLSQCSGKYVCILNPDIYIEKNCFIKLIDFMNKNLGIGCIGPKIVNYDGSLQISCKRSLPTIKNSIYKIIGLDKLFKNNEVISAYNLLYLDEDEINEVEVISGAFMLIRLDVMKEVGAFDESFYLYGEDIDYCHRIKRKGFRTLYYPLAKAIHYKGKSAKSHPFKAIYHFHKSMIKYYTKYQGIYPSWKFLKPFIVISVIIKKYLSYFYLIIKNIFRLR